MNKLTRVLFISMLISLLCVSTVFAHPGRLDKNGGHHDRSTGTYHYHNGGGSSSGSSGSTRSSSGSATNSSAAAASLFSLPSTTPSTNAVVTQPVTPDVSAVANPGLAVLDYVVVAGDKVNVRQQPTTKSKSLGKALYGTMLARYENRADGWSCVNYSGQVAYIKTEFLLNALTGGPAGL